MLGFYEHSWDTLGLVVGVNWSLAFTNIKYLEHKGQCKGSMVPKMQGDDAGYWGGYHLDRQSYG